ncbi:unnamed protein product [marine sediment metagenome]|uniref:Transcription factor zinc-finger domain-containing protein n=1 Tax=marine sediment metagenome TaxID=412755 RepID=X0U178_9ZZZZ
MEGVRLTRYVTVDVCIQCDGMWLDHGELKELVNAQISERADPRTFSGADRTEFMCPDCSRALFKRRLS